MDPKFAREKVEREGCCRLCGKTTDLDGAHLVPKSGSHRGDDVEDNSVPLCGPGHSGGCHRLVDLNIGNARRRLRKVLTIEEIAYVVMRKGRVYLNDRYPVGHG